MIKPVVACDKFYVNDGAQGAVLKGQSYRCRFWTVLPEWLFPGYPRTCERIANSARCLSPLILC